MLVNISFVIEFSVFMLLSNDLLGKGVDLMFITKSIYGEYLTDVYFF